MPDRTVTNAPHVNPLITGRFTEEPTYNTWRPSGTRDYLLILTVSGSGRFGHAHGEVTTVPGDLVIVRPGTPHDYATMRGAVEWGLLWAHFLPRPFWQEWITGLPTTAPGIALLSLGDSSPARVAVESALDAMDRYATGGLPRRTEFAMNALEAALLHCDAANPLASARSKFDERVFKVMEILRGERLAQAISLDKLARTVNLSPSRLSHLFKAQTGRTPGQFQEEERLIRARQLLTLTNRSITAIAEEIGFASPFYFTLRFKKHIGQSPREFRRNAG
ncbi:MAG: helix-turn-helix domain-containing protein [Fibrella sp.]|nr:helix-turn-helix domain-containing protein [Armatimonadota bacterium]